MTYDVQCYSGATTILHEERVKDYISTSNPVVHIYLENGKKITIANAPCIIRQAEVKK